MPRNNELEKILLIGSGPIVIGQGCEFDYSGVQACKALREEGYRVVLVKSPMPSVVFRSSSGPPSPSVAAEAASPTIAKSWRKSPGADSPSHRSTRCSSKSR